MTTIGASMTITGEITSREDVTIHGNVSGKITMHGGALQIAQTAVVTAEAKVNRVTIQGSYTGDVTAVERIELTGTSSVSGTVIAPSVVLQDGAVFNGVIEADGRRKQRAA
jgi:cytoskeletal protein CcmA (bactofilin family)